MIMVLMVILALLGMGLVGLLVIRLHQLNAEYRLKRHQQPQASVADLLNYAAVVDEGVIVGKNGALMAAWVYQGDDTASSTREQRELVSFRLNQALARLGSGWMIHVDAVRRAAPRYSAREQSHFPDPVSAAIDEERRCLFERLDTLYEGFFVLTVTWLPPLLVQRQFVALMFDDEASTPSKKSQTIQLLAQFNRDCATLESRLSTVLTLERLTGQPVMQDDGTQVTHDHFLAWLHYCLTGLHHPIHLPSQPIYLDALLGGQELWTGVIPKLGRQFIQCVAIEGFPLASSPGMLNALAELALDYRWSSRFIFLDSHDALHHLERFRKKWKQKIRGFMAQVFHTQEGMVDDDALAMVADADAAMADTNSGMVAQGYYTSVVVLRHEQREVVEAAARLIEKTIHALGFAARTETINTLDALLGTLPGHGVENVRRPLLNTFNLADLLPVSTLWTGDHHAPSPLFPPQSPPLLHAITQGHSPFRVNLHVRDLGHSILFGPTRAGKSTHVSLIALQWRRYPGARIYAFDKGLSMLPTCLAVGGHHYTLGADDSRLAFAPLQRLDTPSERAWAMEWLDKVLALNHVATTAAQRNEIGHAIMTMHHSQAQTLSDFTVTIQDEAIRAALYQYTIDGAMGHLFDAEQDGLVHADFITFELEQLMTRGEKVVLPVLLYLFHRIEASLDGRPTLIILDEAWLMLAHPIFRSKIAEWLDSMAKKNCTVLMATQHLSHAAQSGILDVIVESTASKIFLPNAHAHDSDTRVLYGRMGLNAQQIDIIATALPKHDYYYVSDKGRRLYQLALGPLALAIVGATDKESLAIIQNLVANHGEAWVERWLATKGLRLTHEEVATCVS